MPDTTVTIRGIEETLSALTERLEGTKLQARKAVNRAALAYEGDVKRIAPVDTGQYRASISYKMDINELIAYVGTPLPQACRLEFGFWNKQDKLGRRYFQRAQPHFRPALDLNREKYLAIIKGEFDANAGGVWGSY